jgi:hypothetical protein
MQNNDAKKPILMECVTCNNKRSHTTDQKTKKKQQTISKAKLKRKMKHESGLAQQMSLQKEQRAHLQNE